MYIYIYTYAFTVYIPDDLRCDLTFSENWDDTLKQLDAKTTDQGSTAAFIDH